MNEIRARGTQDILIAVVDGLKGLSRSDHQRSFPTAIVQTCIVHLIRYSMQFASWKERKLDRSGAEADLPRASAEAAAAELEAFDQGAVGTQISGDRAELAAQLGGGHSVLCVSRRGPQDHLHDQRNREPECLGAQGGPQQGAFSERPGGDETDLAGAAQHRPRNGRTRRSHGMLQGAVGGSVRKSIHCERVISSTGSHTKFLTLPRSILQAVTRRFTRPADSLATARPRQSNVAVEVATSAPGCSASPLLALHESLQT